MARHLINNFILFSFLFLAMGFFRVEAAPLALGGSVGMDFPFAHSDETDPGISAEGFYRIDPYEVRFHFGNNEIKYYSVSLALKHFFSHGVVRPYIEGALGALIADTPVEGLAYGAKPEVSLGADIGVSKHFSTGLAARYFGMTYFGSTSSGKWESNHGLSVMANVILWF